MYNVVALGYLVVEDLVIIYFPWSMFGIIHKSNTEIIEPIFKSPHAFLA